jgi:hypothetical protein
LLFGRKRFRQDLDEEMSFHREQAEKDFVRNGNDAGGRAIRGDAAVRKC